MKKTLILYIFIIKIISHSTAARELILITGKPSYKQNSLRKVMKEHFGFPSSLIKFDMKNSNCNKNKASLIQLCIQGKNISVVHLKAKTFNQTLGRIISSYKKSLHTEGLKENIQ